VDRENSDRDDGGAREKVFHGKRRIYSRVHGGRRGGYSVQGSR
jgi:hypothetical protein